MSLLSLLGLQRLQRLWSSGPVDSADSLDAADRSRAEDSIAVRVAVLVTVLIAVAAVGMFEEFTGQALFAGAAIAAGFWLSYRRRHARNGWLKVGVAILVLLVARDFLASLLANPYDPRIPLVRLFLWLQALHSLDVPRRRDLKYSLLSAVVLMAVGAAYARDLAFGLWLIPFTAAAAVALVTMQAADARVIGGRMVRRGAGVLAGIAAAGAVLIFVAVPRAEGLRARVLPMSAWLARQLQLQGRIVNPAYPEEPGRESGDTPPVFNPSGYIGFSTYVDLRLRGQLTHDLVLRVRATRPAFWRGLAFDTYTGRGWRMSDPAVTEFTAVQGRVALRFSADEPWPAGSEQVIQTFYVEADQPNVIFGAYRISEVFFPSGSIEADRYAGVRSPIPLEQGVIYSVISRAPSPTPAVLRSAARPVPQSVADRYLQLPPMPDRVTALARRLAAGPPTAYDTAMAINRFLWREYAYTLQAPPLPEGADAVDDFLFASRRGSCEAFASAMVVLLRAAGIPARLVTGYTTGNYNLLTGYYEVFNSDAHAWVEVYLPRAGWLPFEPTPGFATPEPSAARRPGQWLAADAAQWIAARVHTGWVRLAAAVQRVQISSSHALNPSVGTAAILALALVLVRRRRAVSPDRDPMDIAAQAYARMLELLGPAGFHRAPALTPREFAGALPEPLRGPVGTITAWFERVHYGGVGSERGDTHAASALLASLRRAVRQFRHQ